MGTAPPSSSGTTTTTEEEEAEKGWTWWSATPEKDEANGVVVVVKVVGYGLRCPFPSLLRHPCHAYDDHSAEGGQKRVVGCLDDLQCAPPPMVASVSVSWTTA